MDLGLTLADEQHLPASKKHLAPTTETDAEAKYNRRWAEIKAWAVKAALKANSRAASSGSGGQSSSKRPRMMDFTPRAKEPRFASYGRGGPRRSTEDGEGVDSEDSEEQQLSLLVDAEIERYNALYIRADELDTRDILPWWRETGRKMFPYLAPVAQQVFGNQAGAAQVERDFSACGNLLVPNRSRIDTYWVEMLMFLKVNYKHIPALKDTPMIADKDIRKCLPAKFTGARDADLNAAEAALDVVNNTANDIGV
ncbi:unnamed protein product [Pylaiella littoralis]